MSVVGACAYRTPRRVDKPWGYELIWAEAERLRRQAALRARRAVAEPPVPRGEGRVVARAVEGRASLELGEVGGALETVEIGAGDAFRYRPGTVHRVTAIEDTMILEVSTPHLDDVVRLEDRYGREGTSAP